ncbi:MAG: alpha/beta fold hydrolase [Candidatus Hydrogenedentota bacterium]|nr:MAG: alpha/beta fold hydrolase [Candidatus Hydrogenedentota bacterium]
MTPLSFLSAPLPRLGIVLLLSLLVLAILLPIGILWINMHPVSPPATTSPSDFQLSFETLKLVTIDGVPVEAWLIPGDSGAGLVVMVHGLGADKSSLLPLARVVHRTGAHALLVDLRNHGGSGPARTTFGLDEALDVTVAVEAAERRDEIDRNRIVGYGLSMGAATVVSALIRHPGLRGFFLDSPFDSLDALFGDIAEHTYHLPRAAARLSLWAYRFLTGTPPTAISPASLLAQRPVPLVVVHGRRDERIPIERGQRLFQAASGEKTFYETESDHTLSWSDAPEEYENRLEDFLRRTMR